MGKLFYNLLSGKVLKPKEKNVLKNMEIFVIDNVTEYVNENTQKLLTIDDLPNIKPPFKSMFVETNSPKFILDEKSNKTGWPWNYGLKWGYYVFYTETEKNIIIHIIEYSLYQKSKQRPNFTYTKKSPSWYIKLTKNGKPQKDGLYKNTRKGKKLKYEKLMPLLYSLALMNCGNIEYIENSNTKIKNRDNKRKGICYKTLKVNPMAEATQTKSKNNAGNKNPLHVCRGHFKDYRKKGLFGKYKGIYWWDSQVRGNAEIGEVKKDYEIVV